MFPRNESVAPILNLVVCGVAYMIPAERIEKAFEDAHVVIAVARPAKR
jgi:hypothetical protein